MPKPKLLVGRRRYEAVHGADPVEEEGAEDGAENPEGSIAVTAKVSASRL